MKAVAKQYLDSAQAMQIGEKSLGKENRNVNHEYTMEKGTQLKEKKDKCAVFGRRESNPGSCADSDMRMRYSLASPGLILTVVFEDSQSS